MLRPLHKKAHFLPFLPRLLLLNRWNRGVVLDGKNKLSQKESFRHILVVAPSGAGKSTQYVLPNALKLTGQTSAVFTDPSAELYNTAQAYLQRKGYITARLDFRSHHKALQYNPLAFVSNAVEAQKTADTLIDSAYPFGSKDPFWTDNAKALLGLLVHLLYKTQNTTPTLHQLCEWLFVLSISPSTLDRKVLENLPPLQQKSYQAFFAQDSKVVAGVLSTCKAALGKMVNDPHLVWLTNKNTLDITQLRTRPMALFIIVPEKDIPYFNFILSLLFRQLFDSCTDPPKKDVPYYPIHFFLDEFGQFSIPNFPSYINILRKYQVSVSVIVQEIAQIQAQYGELAPSIIYGGLSHHLYFPGLSPTTVTQLELLLGQKLSSSYAPPFLPRHTIRTLPNKRSLFISSNRPPVLLKMRPWYNSWTLRRRGKKKQEKSIATKKNIG